MLSAVTLPPLPSPLESPAPEPVRAIAPRRRDALRDGARCGLFAAAATAGVVAGFSRYAPGGMLAPFATSGRMLLGVASSEARAAQISALVGGLALHAAVVVGWGVLFALLAGALRGARLWLAGALFAAGVYATSEYILPPLLRLGHGMRPFPSQLALLYTVLALSLVVGMRLAKSVERGDARNASSGT